MADNIRTFDNTVRAPQADSAGSQAFEMEGRHVEQDYAAAGNAIGGAVKDTSNQLEKHYEIQDSSDISAAGATAFQNLLASKNAALANADPVHADEAAQTWREGAMEDEISKIGADAITKHGQEMAQRTQQTLREEFTRQSMGDASTLTGQAVISNMTQMKNGYAQAVSNDPSLLPTAIKMLNGTMNDQVTAHKLNPSEVARIRSEFTDPAAKDLGIAAFQTMAQRNPAAARDALTKGSFAGMFSGDEIGTLTRYADAQEKALSTAQKAAIEQQKQANTADFKAKASEVVGSMLQPDGSLRIAPGSPQKIIALSLHPGAEPGEIKSLADMTETILKDQAKGNKAVSDPATYQSFGTKMVQGNLTAQEIYQARTEGHLSDKDTSYFIRGVDKLAQDPARKEAEKQFNQWAMAQKPAFTAHSLFGTADPVGMQKFNQFMQDAHARFDQAYTSKGDWQGLLNAKNPAYLGTIAKGYMSNVKGASLPPPPHFDASTVDKGFAALKSGQSFIGPDGKLRVKP